MSLNADITGSGEYQGLQDTKVCTGPFPRPASWEGLTRLSQRAAHRDNRITQIWPLSMPSSVIAPPGFAGWGDHTRKYQAPVKLVDPGTDPAEVCRQQLDKKTLFWKCQKLLDAADDSLPSPRSPTAQKAPELPRAGGWQPLVCVGNLFVPSYSQEFMIIWWVKYNNNHIIGEVTFCPPRKSLSSSASGSVNW